ncbi:hypothetical protein NJC38_07545 [Pseudomonas sp. 21LCFQ010]|uniref:BRCT domain-containing protein n=1 Tax=Pseudomonas sp. 21LCFQ010 TaxID=2957506 RepID=UPI002097B503|nr:BRCT domain-containing protein [Pseudomonas sp. 21LCFQ010]MCO8162010.1 hypothetical protein [Pseudomonas sp. 21LCFQ010]
MTALRFTYQNVEGTVAEWSLTRWKENTRYLQGRTASDSIPRTFRKDRVIEYLEGMEYLLGEDAPAVPEPAPRAPIDQRPQVLFTGFRQPDRTRLESLADEKGLRVVKTATTQLAILCGGYNAGPTKLDSARERGAFIVTEEQLLHLFETGEIPV